MRLPKVAAMAAMVGVVLLREFSVNAFEVVIIIVLILSEIIIKASGTKKRKA